jgi:restriction endonuclease Mrr
LIDGSDLAEKLKELSLGVQRETIEVFRVDRTWFESV